MTKEAKLTAAMRIVDEWKDYDNEIKKLQIKQSEHEDKVFNDETQSKGNFYNLNSNFSLEFFDNC